MSKFNFKEEQIFSSILNIWIVLKLISDYNLTEAITERKNDN
jgi:hypothetical protein